MKTMNKTGILFSIIMLMMLLMMGLTAWGATDTYISFVPISTDNSATLSNKRVTFNGYTWYIIEDNSTAVDAGTVTLLAADTSFGIHAFTGDYSNNYTESKIKSTLDALTVSNGSFSDVACAIEENTEAGGKLYLLSVEEANRIPSNVLKMNFDFNEGAWWLRTPGILSDTVAYVDGKSGNVNAYGFVDYKRGLNLNIELGMRPALRLNLSSVIFLSNKKEFVIKTATVDVSEVSLNKTSISLNVGDTETLEATVKPADATNNTVLWSIDNERVATVSNDGIVTAVSPGTATITVTATNGTENTNDDKTANCTVTVNKLNSTITKAPEVKNLTYNGSAQELVTAGTADGGTIYFALGTDDKTAPAFGYTTSIPTGTEVGTYYVWYKVFGDEKHNDTTPVCITVTIGKPGTEKPAEPTPVMATRDAFTGVTETIRISEKGTAVVKSVEDNGRNTLKVTGTVSQNGKTYEVSRFASNSFSDVDATIITIDLMTSGNEQRVTIMPNVFEGSWAEKLKLKLTSASQVKFKSGAFSGSSIKKIMIYGLDKTGFKKVQKNLKASGYKGKIVKR